MSNSITVKVSDYNGDRQIGLDEFVERWTWGVGQIGWLSKDANELAELVEIQNRIKELAVAKFFRTYEADQRKAKEEEKV